MNLQLDVSFENAKAIVQSLAFHQGEIDKHIITVEGVRDDPYYRVDAKELICETQLIALKKKEKRTVQATGRNRTNDKPILIFKIKFYD